MDYFAVCLFGFSFVLLGRWGEGVVVVCVDVVGFWVLLLVVLCPILPLCSQHEGLFHVS